VACGFHVESMLQRGRGVRDEENHWRHLTYLESHSPSNLKAKGGGGGGDGGGRVQVAFVWLSTEELRDISQSGGRLWPLHFLLPKCRQYSRVHATIDQTVSNILVIQ